jgi:hypothetical protein
MIVVRNVFQVKFGKAREATALLKEGVAAQKKAPAAADYSTRILADVTGSFYTLVLELTVPNLAAYEANMPKVMGDPGFQAAYRKMAELVDSGRRDIFTVVD